MQWGWHLTHAVWWTTSCGVGRAGRRLLAGRAGCGPVGTHDVDVGVVLEQEVLVVRHDLAVLGPSAPVPHAADALVEVRDRGHWEWKALSADPCVLRRVLLEAAPRVALVHHVGRDGAVESMLTARTLARIAAGAALGGVGELGRHDRVDVLGARGLLPCDSASDVSVRKPTLLELCTVEGSWWTRTVEGSWWTRSRVGILDSTATHR